jgi:ESX-1-secreted protein regulator
MAELDGPALNAAIVLRDERVRSMVARMSRLSPRSQDSLSDIIDALLAAEGKGEKDS